MAGEGYSFPGLLAAHTANLYPTSLSWNHADVQCRECDEDPLVVPEPNPSNRNCYCYNDFRHFTLWNSLIENTVVVVGKDEQGKLQKNVVKVERLNMDAKKTKLSLTSKGLRSVGTTAKDAIDLKNKNGSMSDVNIMPVLRGYWYNFLSVVGKMKKKSNSSNTFKVEFMPKGRVLELRNDKVTSEIATKFLEKNVRTDPLNALIIMNTDHGNVRGKLIDLRMRNKKWVLKFTPIEQYPTIANTLDRVVVEDLIWIIN